MHSIRKGHEELEAEGREERGEVRGRGRGEGEFPLGAPPDHPTKDHSYR